MNDLNKREIDFIRYMLEETIYQPISYYAKKLNVSTKTLQADLKKIRIFLESYQIEISAGTGRGILITEDARRNIKFLNELNQNESEEEEETTCRRGSILKAMLLNTDHRTSISKLSEQYFVSKTSIVNDMRTIEQWLKKYNLTFEKTKDGTHIQGLEVDIRKAIAGYSLRENTRNELFEIFAKEDVDFVEKLIALVEQNHMNLGDVYYINLLTHILICVKRVSEHNQLTADKEARLINTDTLEEYQKAKKIAEQIDKHFHIRIGDAEIYYIYQYLVSSGFDRNRIQERKERNTEDTTTAFARELTYRLSEKFGIDFYLEEDLMEGLILHIRPMLNRLEYDIQITNPFTDEIMKRYPQMMKYCRDILQELTEKFHLEKVSEGEIANIATYYETMLEKISMHKRILVVCHSGYGTSQLLAAKIRNEFAFMEIMEVVSSREVEEMKLENIDYIISTIPIQRADVPHIVVSALLSGQDIKTIRQRLIEG